MSSASNSYLPQVIPQTDSREGCDFPENQIITIHPIGREHREDGLLLYSSHSPGCSCRPLGWPCLLQLGARFGWQRHSRCQLGHPAQPQALLAALQPQVVAALGGQAQEAAASQACISAACGHRWIGPRLVCWHSKESNVKGARLAGLGGQGALREKTTCATICIETILFHIHCYLRHSSFVSASMRILSSHTTSSHFSNHNH